MIQTSAMSINDMENKFIQFSENWALKNKFRPKSIKESRDYFKKNIDLLWVIFARRSKLELKDLNSIKFSENKERILVTISDKHFDEHCLFTNKNFLLIKKKARTKRKIRVIAFLLKKKTKKAKRNLHAIIKKVKMKITSVLSR